VEAMFITSCKKFLKVVFFFCGLVLLASCDRILTPDFETELTELNAGQYVLDPDHATLIWKINHLGFSTFVGRFNDIEASLDFDPENIQESSLEVIINTAGLDVNNLEFEEELRGSNWFDVENFPQATFISTSFLESDGNSFVFEGDLTLLGNTAPIILDINFNGGGRNFLTRSNTVGFSASATFLRSAYGLDRFTSFGVGDEIELEIHVEFMEQS
jgi:polyisoprenoid-binding protein YceI